MSFVLSWECARMSPPTPPSAPNSASRLTVPKSRARFLHVRRGSRLRHVAAPIWRRPGAQSKLSGLARLAVVPPYTRRIHTVNNNVIYGVYRTGLRRDYGASQACTVLAAAPDSRRSGLADMSIHIASTFLAWPPSGVNRAKTHPQETVRVRACLSGRAGAVCSIR